MPKITGEHFTKLEADCLAVLNKHSIDRSKVQTERDRWDVMHHAKAYWLYDHGYNDNHIDTALRAIFK
jgi:hypothetical protein